MGGKEILAKTVYLEAQGETRKGWRAVAFVIRNRARLNRDYWGGDSIERVCLHPGQFECWDGRFANYAFDKKLLADIHAVTDPIFDGIDNDDPTNGSDHYNNPDKEEEKSWVRKCEETVKIGHHQFYKGP